MKRQIKTGISGLSAAQLVSKTEDIVEAMTGNANFPAPTPDLAALTAANTELKAAATTASFGDKRAIQERDNKQVIVVDLMRQLAAYVSMIANGDGAIITSSGFEMRRLPEPMPPLGRPANFIAKKGRLENTAELEWKTVRGAQTYLIEVTTTDPGTDNATWSTAAITTKVKHTLDNLQRGTYYWYRVMAVGRNTISAFSDVSLLYAA